MNPRPDQPISLALLGGGGHALVVAHVAELSGARVTGFYDDNPRAVCATLRNLPCLGPLRAGPVHQGAIILALGNLAVRRSLIPSLRARDVASAWWCDPALIAAARATVGRGTLLAVQAIIQPFARIGDHAIINSGAIIEHECVIGDNTHIAPGAVLGGNVRVGSDTLIGLGARVLPGVSIGSHCTIGAGAVVTRDVPDHSTIVGVPAKTLHAARPQ